MPASAPTSQAAASGLFHGPLRTPVALYPRSIFRRHFPLTDAPYGPQTLTTLSEMVARYAPEIFEKLFPN